MISRLVGGFVAIIIGVSLIGPISSEVNTAAGPCGMSSGGIYYGTLSNDVCTNGTQTTNTSVTNLYEVSSWGSTVLKLAPGFFALAVLGIGVAVTYGSMKDAGVL